MAKTAKKRKEDLKDMPREELGKRLSLLQEELRTIRFKAEGAKSKNVKESMALRKQIARTLTAINK